MASCVILIPKLLLNNTAMHDATLEIHMHLHGQISIQNGPIQCAPCVCMYPELMCIRFEVNI